MLGHVQINKYKLIFHQNLNLFSICDLLANLDKLRIIYMYSSLKNNIQILVKNLKIIKNEEYPFRKSKVSSSKQQNF